MPPTNCIIHVLCFACEAPLRLSPEKVRCVLKVGGEAFCFGVRHMCAPAVSWNVVWPCHACISLGSAGCQL